jgi:carbon storage regulator
MLVLTRHAKQSIMIGDNIVVTVLEVRGDQVRLGIRAPRDIDVHREEVYDALRTARRSAVPAATVVVDLSASTSADEPVPSAEPVDS